MGFENMPDDYGSSRHRQESTSGQRIYTDSLYLVAIVDVKIADGERRKARLQGF